MQSILISMTNEDYQCPSCKVVISNNHENPQIIRPQRSNCPYCGSRFDLRGRSRRYKCITYMLNYKFFNNFFFFQKVICESRRGSRKTSNTTTTYAEKCFCKFTSSKSKGSCCGWIFDN